MFIFKLTRIKSKTVTLILIFFSLIFVRDRIVQVSQSNLPTPLEHVNAQKKAIALAINVDWGEECIPKMLVILAEHKAKVTFFVTGRWAQKNPELLKYMASQGHQVENHGYYHSHPDKLSVVQNKDELLRTEKAIFEIIGKKTIYYAPPYGERGRNGLIAAEELNYTTVLWTLDTIDWRSDSTPELIYQRILEPKIRYGLKPEKKGAIVLMHPKENTVIALPRILSSLREEGYEVVTLEKLITFGLSGNTTP